MEQIFNLSTSNQQYTLEEVETFLVNVIPNLINHPLGELMQANAIETNDPDRGKNNNFMEN